MRRVFCGGILSRPCKFSKHVEHWFKEKLFFLSNSCKGTRLLEPNVATPLHGTLDDEKQNTTQYVFDTTISQINICVVIVSEWLLFNPHLSNIFSFISCREQVNCQWDEDEVRIVLDQHVVIVKTIPVFSFWVPWSVTITHSQ
jgi:hypothetical protein